MSNPIPPYQADIVVLGATPAGVTAAIAAAREGQSVLLLERTAHIGGLIANGLGATDIATRGATGGLFAEFIRRVLRHYTDTYGADSEQVRDCGDGYHFEPSVAGKILTGMIAEQPGIKVLLQRQFDSLPENVTLDGTRLTGILILNRETKAVEKYQARLFIDATYEGDLAAAAGAPYRLGREDQREFNEPMAGQVYQAWGGGLNPGSTGRGDNAIQSYNYRLPLTRNPANRVPVPRPATYRREEYVSIIDDLRLNRHVCVPGDKRDEWHWDNIGRIVTMVMVPNGKTHSNHQHATFISTDLPEENWPWPTSNWAWRDQYALRLRDYILGLLWFCQNDPKLPAEFCAHCSEWGLSRDEYVDNNHFPRQVYVREGRRIMGRYLFTANDALPVVKGGRPPVHAGSITASHYPLDSHAVRKREPDRLSLDGFFSYPSQPYTVPYGVMVPNDVEGLLVPTAASATHIGFSTLRMEPCWMALGEAAGTAASLALTRNQSTGQVDLVTLQRTLLRHGAVLFYFRDVAPGHAWYEAIEMLGLRGLLPEWEARPDEPLTASDGALWSQAVGVKASFPAGSTPTRGEFLDHLWKKIVTKAATGS